MLHRGTSCGSLLHFVLSTHWFAVLSLCFRLRLSIATTRRDVDQSSKTQQIAFKYLMEELSGFQRHDAGCYDGPMRSDGNFSEMHLFIWPFDLIEGREGLFLRLCLPCHQAYLRVRNASSIMPTRLLLRQTAVCIDEQYSQIFNRSTRLCIGPAEGYGNLRQHIHAVIPPTNLEYPRRCVWRLLSAVVI